jgi:HPt (histidine-containing phosphotransfer) domain-containing protein
MGSSSGSNASAPVIVELPEDYRELVAIYLETRAANLKALEQALGAADFQAIERIGHNLRGSSASFGFNAAGDIGLALQQAAGRADATEVRTLVHRLRDYLDHLDVRYVTAQS